MCVHTLVTMAISTLITTIIWEFVIVLEKKIHKKFLFLLRTHENNLFVEMDP